MGAYWGDIRLGNGGEAKGVLKIGGALFADLFVTLLVIN
jgi:hypothetical protein